MSYYAPKLPLKRDKQTGYEMLEDLRNVVKQNFKMLILTTPGERIMMPAFGVGVYKLLWEPYGPDVENKIRTAINAQAKKYLPYLEIKSIQFGQEPETVINLNVNSLSIAIEYYVKSLNFSDVLKIDVNQQFQ
jgi:phage baseplate assembly protein W